MNLRELDERLLPRAAERFVEALAGFAGAPGSRPGRARKLREVDDRVARSGPLSLLVRRPQLGALVIAAVLLTATGAALARSGTASAVTAPILSAGARPPPRALVTSRPA